MIITIYSAKGGVGKTSIATNIILDREYAIGCNECENAYKYFIPEDRRIAIDLSHSFPSISNDIDMIIDLGGVLSAISRSITSALLQSDLVFVPIEDEFKSLQKGIETLKEINALEGFNGVVMVIATKLKKERKERFSDWEECKAFKNIKSNLEEEGFNFPMLALKESSVYDTIFEKEKSIEQLCEPKSLASYSYRVPLKQFKKIYNAIDDVDKRINNAKQKQPSQH